METETLLAIGAGATFLLAIAAFWAIWQNYIFRKEDRERDFKRRSLKEINDWAEMVYNLVEKHERERLLGLSNLDKEMRRLTTKTKGILKIAPRIDSEFAKIVNKAIEDFKVFRYSYEHPETESYEMKDGTHERTKPITKEVSQCKESLTALVEEIANRRI